MDYCIWTPQARLRNIQMLPTPLSLIFNYPRVCPSTAENQDGQSALLGVHLCQTSEEVDYGDDLPGALQLPQRKASR